MHGGALGLLNGACGASIRRESESCDGEKFTVGHRAVLFYRTRIPISCRGRTLSRRRIEFQLGSRIRLDLEIIFGLTMVEQGISCYVGRLLP
jgi:hypothetical protein